MLVNLVLMWGLLNIFESDISVQKAHTLNGKILNGKKAF